MTLATGQGYTSQVCAGDLAPIAINFPVYTNIDGSLDLTVQLRDATTNALLATAVYPTHYTFTRAAAPAVGGTLTPLSAIVFASGRKAWVLRTTKLHQETKFAELVKFPGQATEQSVDRNMAGLQDLGREQALALRAPRGETPAELEPASVRASKPAVFDSSGNLVAGALGAGEFVTHPSWADPLTRSLATQRPFAIIGRAMNIQVPDVDFEGVDYADAGLIAALGELNDAGRGKLDIPRGAVLRTYPAGMTNTWVTFEGTRGVELAWNGARIVHDRPYTGSQATFPIVFGDDNESVVIGDHEIVCTNPETMANAYLRGPWFYVFGQRGRGLRMGHVKILGGKIGVDFSTTDVAERWSDIRIASITGSRMGYPYSGRHNGDDVYVAKLRAVECTRPAIAYNWLGKLEIGRLSERDCGTQALFLNNTSPSELAISGTSTTGELVIDHNGEAKTLAAHGESCRVALEQRGSSPGRLGPWRVTSETAFEQAGALTQQQIIIMKTTASGALDTTPSRGHVGEIDLDLIARGVPATSVAWLMAPAAQVGDWTGENVALVVDGLNYTGEAGSSVHIKHGLVSGPVLRDVRMPGLIAPEGTPGESFVEANVTDKTGRRTSASLAVGHGFLYGLNLANSTSDATNDIDIAAGRCLDATNARLMICAAMTKQLDAGWSAGSNAGMRYSGAAIANTTYHIYVATKGDGTQDYYADPSAVIATVLGHLQAETGGADYLYLRRIGSILRESASIVAFDQDGDRFTRRAYAVSVALTANPGTTAVTRTLSVPTGIVVDAIVTYLIYASASTALNYALMTELTQTDVAASITAHDLSTQNSGGEVIQSSELRRKTNTSGQVRTRQSVSDGNHYTGVLTKGWIDTRGQQG